MTLQIALTGTNGIVLASDRKLNIERDSFNTTVKRTKILINHERRIAACWSGEQRPSAWLADHIVRNMTDKDLQYPYPALGAISKEIVSQPGIYGETYREANVIVVTIQEDPKAYDITATKETCECWQQDKIVKGHLANPALFFAERYYGEGISIDRLTFLAAHIIVNAGRIRPRAIEDLEMICCTNKGFSLFSTQQMSSYMAWSDTLDTKIKQLVLSGPEESAPPK